jgi:23S rRNA (cytosine1962-C5)-methyltransferase
VDGQSASLDFVNGLLPARPALRAVATSAFNDWYAPMTMPGPELPRLIRFEDEHLLVVNKPAGMNTHAPAPFAGEGLYEWLRHRDQRWARLAIIHRLDRETSGVMVFAKSSEANRSLTAQFAGRDVGKTYRLVTDRTVPQREIKAVSSLVRAGDRYVSRPVHAGSQRAETHFRAVETRGGLTTVEAEPRTGRTHQIRVHTAEHGFPILGDALYGGTPGPRLFLHASELKLKHPVTGAALTFQAAPDFDRDWRLALRAALIAPAETNVFRVIHGATDGWPGWYVDRLGDLLLSQAERPLTAEQTKQLEHLMHALTPRITGVYHKALTRRVGLRSVIDLSPRLVLGKTAPERFIILENGVRFEASFAEGYSVGLFLDQRENRRRFLVNYVAADFPLFPEGAAGRELLNTFAYTCGFSVCAAKAGARTTSVDLSKKYLEWGKRNFALNELDPAAHEFIYGDASDWLRRLRKKQRLFDAIVLDPPTFSQSKASGAFRAERDYAKLVSAALPLLKVKGVILASSNAAGLKPEDFVQLVETAVAAAQRSVVQRHYVPQPPDFPVSRAEPPYLKTIWLRVV